MKIKHFLLAGILVLASVLRLWNLNNIPPHLTPDEASLGYNAYSILKTGKDEYGEPFPIVFKSFGDYKPGLYVYSAVPFVAVFGLNEWSTRLPSALAGIIAVYLVFLIVRLIWKERSPALVAAFVMSLNPWHIHFSRGAWEVNLALTLTLAGIFFFLKSFENKKYLLASAVFFASTLLAYQGAKLSTAIVLICLGISFFKQVKKLGFKPILLSGIVGIVIALPILVSMIDGRASRLNVFSVFSYPRPKTYLEDFLVQANENVGDYSYYLFHSEGLNFARGIAGRWFNHFSGRFLFFEGDWANPRHSPPNHGQLLTADLLFLLIGGFIVMTKHTRSQKVFLLSWLFLAPFSAALSRDSVHAVRSLNMSIPLVIIISHGLLKVLQSSKLIKIAPLTLFSLSLVYYLDAYFVHLSKHQSHFWEYGYKQMVEVITPIQSNYKEIKVQQSYAQPYIYFLFYQKYDPWKYQQTSLLQASDNASDVGLVKKLDNICFCAIDWPVERGKKGNLVVADIVKMPVADSIDTNQFSLIKEIKYLNNRDTAFRIIGIKP